MRQTRLMARDLEQAVLTRNSSLTRVRPFFGQLLDRDPTGDSWIGALLGGPVPAEVQRGHGSLRHELVECRRYRDRVLKASVWLRCCFEHSIEPSGELLTWLLEAPHERLRAPVQWTGGADTVARRQALLDPENQGHTETLEAARAALARHGPTGSARKWWAFEGFTEADCLLRTDRLTLIVEGKRTESLAGDTEWLPKRNQLARNLEAAFNAGEHGYVLLALEEELPELDVEKLVAGGCPHLDADVRSQVAGRFLGQRTWAELCQATDVDWRSLPHAIAITPTG
jgi:hypothetical protein